MYARVHISGASAFLHMLFAACTRVHCVYVCLSTQHARGFVSTHAHGIALNVRRYF